MKKRFWAFALMVVMLISIFPVSVLAEAPGTRQQLTKESLEGGTFDVYHSKEKIGNEDVVLTLYCFNSELSWPSTSHYDPTLQDYYVPDDLLYLSPAVRDKIYRVLYAGYPHNNLGLFSEKEEHADINELRKAVVPTEELKLLLTKEKGYNWDGLDFTPEKLIDHTTSEYARMNAMSSSGIASDDAYLDAMSNNPHFITILNYWGILGDDHVVKDLDSFLENYDFFKPKLNNGTFHDITQYAIWRILYENKVPNNSKPFAWALSMYPLAKQLVDFANGKGEHANAYIPSRETKIDDILAYRDEFITGSKLLRADGTPVGSDPIVFTYDGSVYVSEPLHFENKTTYVFPYDIILKDGGTIISTPYRNFGDGEFQLRSTEKPSDGIVTVDPHDEFPSDVYEYVNENQKDLSLEERSIQDMAGVYYQSVDMATNFKTQFREKEESGNLKVTKTVNGYPAEASSKKFKFTVKLSEEKINGLYGSMNFENGVATFTLEGGHFREAANLPVGITYTVTEEDYTGASFTTEKNGDTGTITKDHTSTASFVNTYKAKSVDVALKGNKTMNGKNLSEGEFSFTITGDMAGGTVTVKNKADGSIDFGTYRFDTAGIYTFVVKEVNDGRDGINYDNTVYNITVTVTDDGSGQLKAAIAGCAPTGDNINFTNGIGGGDDHDDGGGSGETSITRNGSLTISKNVTGDLGDKNKLFTFHVAFNTDNYYAYTGSKTGVIKNGGTLQLKDGESITINGIPSGVAYAIVESDNAGYRVYKTGDAGIIVADQTLKASFTNTKSSVPQTGDNRHLFIWMSIMAISFIGCIISLVFTIRKRESHE